MFGTDTHFPCKSTCFKPHSIPGVGFSCLQEPVGDFLPPAFNYKTPGKIVYSGIAYSDLFENGTMVNNDIPVLFNEGDLEAIANLSKIIWYALSFLETLHLPVLWTL
jgi:hypothetical protein